MVEACEYRRSFLNLSPKILVITNIDNDHLDYYKDIADIVSAFNEIVRKVPKDGFIICNPEAPHMQGALLGAVATIIDYTQCAQDRLLRVPGKHNQANAAAATAAAATLGVPSSLTETALSHFSGTWRRFEYKGKTAGGALVYDDYGHHPTEIRATLSGARELFSDKKIIAVFQPHLFSRTKLLLLILRMRLLMLMWWCLRRSMRLESRLIRASLPKHLPRQFRRREKKRMRSILFGNYRTASGNSDERYRSADYRCRRYLSSRRATVNTII